MKKKDIAKKFEEKGGDKNLSKEVIKDIIRSFSDDDEAFENLIFEVGCDEVTKKIKKEKDEKIDDDYCYGVLEYSYEAIVKYCGKEMLLDFHFCECEEEAMLILNRLLYENFNGDVDITIKPYKAWYSKEESDEFC